MNKTKPQSMEHKSFELSGKGMADTNLALEAADTVATALANKVTAVGAVTGAVGWLASVNWIGLVGVLIAACGLGASIYFQLRRDRRETAESEMRIALMTMRNTVNSEMAGNGQR